MNKKGEGSLWAIDSMPSYVIFIVFVSFCAVLFIIFTQYYSADQYRFSAEIKNTITTERFFTTCFTNDQSKIIFWENFNKEFLDECYRVDESSETAAAYRITLSVDEKTQVISTSNWKNKPVDEASVHSLQVSKEGIIKNGALKIEVYNE